MDKGRNVSETNGPHVTVKHRRPSDQPTGRCIYGDTDFAVGSLQTSALERPRYQCNRSVPARGAVAGIVKEDHAKICTGIVRGRDEAAIHIGVAARLVDEEASNVVDICGSPQPTLAYSRTADLRRALDDDPERLTSGVVVDRVHFQHVVTSAHCTTAAMATRLRLS